jgi:hypothetical protein
MDQSRLACASCGRNIPACATCGRQGCPDPACHECLAERTGLPQNALWVIRQARGDARQLRKFAPPPPAQHWGN